MNTPVKITAYVAMLAVAFGGAFGVGRATGSPIDRPDDHDAHSASDDPTSAGSEVPHGLQVSQAGYTLSPIIVPGTVGEAGKLSFAILDADGTPLTEFTELHEKDLHLIVVRSDTAEYRHVHPVVDAEGTWSIDWAWEAAGTYKVFADFEPAGLGHGLTLARTVDVAGEYIPESTSTATVTDADGYTVTLSGDLVAGESSVLTLTVERDGQPVADLEPYLGAYGHLVALREGDLAFVHVHPNGTPGDGSTVPGPDVAFAIEAPSTGSYRLFFDFQVDGGVRTADFTVAVSEPDSTGTDGGGLEPQDTVPRHDGGHVGH